MTCNPKPKTCPELYPNQNAVDSAERAGAGEQSDSVSVSRE